MKIILVHTTLMIVFLSMLFTGCSKNEDNSENNINLPGGIDLRAVGMANFSAPSSRASIEPIIVDTVKIAEDLYAEISITEASEEIATRANETSKLPKDTRFRLIALDDKNVKAADIIYQIKDENGRAEIVSGSGEGYKVGDGGKKYFQLEPGKSYKMIGFSDGNPSDQEDIVDSLTYTWKNNYMKFVTVLTVADGINQFGPTFQHMNAAMQIVINTSKTGNNVTAASAVMWQQNKMPIQNEWSYTTDEYKNNLIHTSGSEANSASFVWTSPNSQNVASNLQYFTPGAYGSIKLKFKNITVGGVDYNNINLIDLDPVKMAALQRNKKYIVKVGFIPPFTVTITDNVRRGYVSEPRLITVTATGALPPYSYEWTIVSDGATSSFTNEQHTYQHSLNGNYKRMDYAVKCIVHDSSGKKVSASLKSVLKQVITKSVTEVPVSEVPWMQNWDSSIANAEIVAGGTYANRIRYVRDQRDNIIYRIKKLSDGRWWMMQSMSWRGVTPCTRIGKGIVARDAANSMYIEENLQGDIMYRNNYVNSQSSICPEGWSLPSTIIVQQMAIACNWPAKTDAYNETYDPDGFEWMSTPHCLSNRNETYPRDYAENHARLAATGYYQYAGYSNVGWIPDNNGWAHNHFSVRCFKNVP